MGGVRLRGRLKGVRTQTFLSVSQSPRGEQLPLSCPAAVTHLISTGPEVTEGTWPPTEPSTTRRPSTLLLLELLISSNF